MADENQDSVEALAVLGDEFTVQDIVDAARHLREQQEKSQTVVWRIGDLELTQDDFTVGETRKLQQLLNVPWYRISPLTDIEHGHAVLSTFIARDAGWDEASRRVDAMTQKQFDEMWFWRDDEPEDGGDGDPKAIESLPPSTTS